VPQQDQDNQPSGKLQRVIVEGQHETRSQDTCPTEILSCKLTLTYSDIKGDICDIGPTVVKHVSEPCHVNVFLNGKRESFMGYRSSGIIVEQIMGCKPFS
jgi:hypothetical protein